MLEKKPKIESGQPQESGKLTLEEIKEMVNKYKKEHEGLLPEFFSLPGEEVEVEEERQCSEETLLAHEIKEFLEKIRPEIENKTLIKNAGECLRSNIESGQEPVKTIMETVKAWFAVHDYFSFKQSGLWPKFDQEFREWVEKNIQNPQLIKNAEENLKDEIESGQEPGQTVAGWLAVYGYASFKQSGLWPKFDQEFREWVEKNIQNPQLIKNAEEDLKHEIESGQKEGGAYNMDQFYSARNAVRGYPSFKQSGLWPKFDQEFREWVEKNIQNPQLIKNAEEDLKLNIKSGQKWGRTDNVRNAGDAVEGYAYLSQFQKILEEEGRRKEISKATEKAMHPEKKLPPIPEEKAF